MCNIFFQSQYGRSSQKLAEFLPSALEIQETPPNPLARLLALSLLIFISIFFIWVCVGQVNIVASAEGKILPSSRVKQIQPLTKGIIKSISVSEGEYVKEGQELIELDTTLTFADQNRLQKELQSLKLNVGVNRALVNGFDYYLNSDSLDLLELDADGLIDFPVSTTDLEMKFYRDFFDEQWQQYRSQHHSLLSALKKTQYERAAVDASIKKYEQTVPITRKLSETLKGLKEKKFVSEVDFLQAERDYIQQEQELAVERHRKNQLLAAEVEVEEQIKTYVAQTKTNLLTSIKEQELQISSLEEELIKAIKINNTQILYSPVSGRVQQLAVNTVGGVVTDAQVLMLIVPDENDLEVEVFLENKDIGFVNKNMPVEIKVHTFPFTKYGVVDADIINISTDAIVDEKKGLIYSMHLRMKKNLLSVEGKDMSLIPGMSVTAEVTTGKRRIIEFFLAPLVKANNESIRER